MVDSVIGPLVTDLTRYLQHESDLLHGVKDEVRSLHNELLLMSSFLRSFERKHNAQETMNEVLSQLRDIAYEAENIIDMYVVNVDQQRRGNLLGKLKHKYVKIKTRHDVARNIENIRKRIEQIHKNRDRYNDQILQVGESSMEVVSRGRKRLPIAEGADVVGLVHETETIINRLMGSETGLHVVPIVGMGGLGKTTLARKVYEDRCVQEHFKFRVWVNVSKDFKERNLMQAIIKGAKVFGDEMEMNDEDISTARKYLMNKKYLIVLDDVWKWDELNVIFADSLHGSRIILTTRNKEVANCAKGSSEPYYLGFRNEAESWELLCKKAFRGGSCPQELEELGKKIAEKCQGLPLAINAIAGFLPKKEDRLRWWPKVLSRVSSLLIEQREQCMDILALSYEDLPYHLKCCFRYFGVFLRDIEIPTRQLIQLWIAEGFVKEHLSSVEDVAQDYLEELIDKNLIQAAKLRFDGGVKACHIHDVLRYLCILKAGEDKFIEVRGNLNLPSTANPRRLAVHSDILNCISSNPFTSNLRSFLCFSNLDEGQLSSEHWELIYKRFTLLNVLDLWGVVVDSIPSEVEKLNQLRYLRLRSCIAPKLPSSICKLQNLKTLEVRAPSIDRPHIIIWKMRQLRHLYFHGKGVVLPQPGDRDEALNDLQTLSGISPGSCTEGLLSKLPKLVKLRICGDLKAHMDDKKFSSISVLKQLQTLKLEREEQYQSLTSIDWIEFPEKITKLTLSKTQLSTDPMQKLGKLNELQILKLTNDAYVGDVLHCASGGFPQLKVLKLIDLNFKEWNIDSGSMASLRKVVISGCTNLQGLPLALQNMSTLRELELWSPNASVLCDSNRIQDHIGSELLKLTIKQ